MHDFRDHIFLARSSQFATRESAGCDLATRWVMENGAEECNAIVNMAELAHARSIRGVSACSDPRLVYKTLVVGIMPSSGKCPPHRGVHRKRTTFPMKCRERKCSCGQHYKVTKNVTKFLSLVEFSTRARLAEWLRRSPAKIVLQL